MSEHKVGDLVMIYLDPVTEERQEGQAELIEIIQNNLGQWQGRTLQSWRVRFPDEQGTAYLRQLMTPRE